MQNNLTPTQEKYLQEYNFDKNLIFGWPPGTGKTYTAINLLKKSEKTTYKISDARFKELLSTGSLRLKKPEERQSKITEFPLEMMIKVPVLLYDDIWTSDTTEAYLRKLTFVLDERIERNLITLFTTNFTCEGLEKKLNERLKSRIYFNTDTLDIIWKDLRDLSTNKNIR